MNARYQKMLRAMERTAFRIFRRVVILVLLAGVALVLWWRQ